MINGLALGKEKTNDLRKMPIVWCVPSHDGVCKETALRNVPPRGADLDNSNGGEEDKPEMVAIKRKGK